MTDARTRTSHWVYRIALALLVVGTFLLGRFWYNQSASNVGEVRGVFYWVAVSGALSNTMALALAAIAMVLRSGSVVWLLALQLGLSISMFLPAFMMSESTEPVLKSIALVAGILIVGAALFVYLIRKGEIRQP